MLKKIILAPIIILSLSGCASVAEIVLPSDTPPPFREASLEIKYSETGKGDSNMMEPVYETYTLECNMDGRYGGTHPNPNEACNHLRENTMLYQIKPDIEPQACTMIYGGPQEAVISGFINGREIRFDISRTNGCEITEWDSWVPVIPEPSQWANFAMES